MPVLYNYATKKVENVPEANVTDLVKTGGYGFRNNSQIPAVTPDGQKVYLSPEEATNAFNAGYTYETLDMMKQAGAAEIQQNTAEAFDSPFTAGAAGVLRGATLGLSDAAFAGLGLGEELSNLKEINPGASLTGEITGGILGMATGAAPIAQVGKLATKAGATLAKTGLGKAITSGVIEGSAMGLGNVISQASLSDPDLNMSHAIQEVGLGGILGGLFGAGMKGVAYSMNKLKDAAANLKMGEKVGKSFATITNLIKQVDPEDRPKVTEMFTTKADKMLEASLNPHKVVLDATDALKELDSLQKTTDMIAMGLRDSYREQLQDSAITLANPVKQLAKQVQGSINELQSSAFYNKGDIPKLAEIKENLLATLPNLQTKQDAHLFVESQRKLVDSVIKYGTALSPLNAGDNKTNEVLRALRSNFADHLKSEKHYGKFGNAYDEINKAYSLSRQVSDSFEDAFKSKVEDLSGTARSVIDENKVNSYIRNPESIRSLGRGQSIKNAKEVIKAYESLINKYADEPELANGILQDIQRISGTIESLEDSRTLAILFNSLESRTGKSLAGAAIGAGIGTVGGATGVGAAAGYALTNPVTTFKYIKAMEKYGSQGYKKLVDSIDSFSGKTNIPSGGFKGAKLIGIGELIDLFSEEPKEKKDYNELKSVLDATSNDINPILNKLDRNNPRFGEDFEEHYVAAANMGQQVASFLNSKLPAKSQNALFPTDIRLTKAEEQKFMTYANTALNPSIFFEEIANGRVKPEVSETMQAVYPRLFEETRKEMFNAAVNNPNMPYQRKLQIAKIFQVPTTPAIENLGVLQASYMTAPVEKDSQVGNVAALADANLTPLQSLA